MAYATYADMLLRFDQRTIADLCTDKKAHSPDLSTDARLLAALSAGSGRVNSALLVANLYLVADLEGLTGDDLEYLKDIVCALALAWLVMRRPSPENTEWAKAIIEPAEDALDRMRRGENLLNLSSGVPQDAGLAHVDGPTRVEYDNLNLTRDRLGGHYFPVRQLPLGRG